MPTLVHVRWKRPGAVGALLLGCLCACSPSVAAAVSSSVAGRVFTLGTFNGEGRSLAVGRDGTIAVSYDGGLLRMGPTDPEPVRLSRRPGNDIALTPDGRLLVLVTKPDLGQVLEQTGPGRTRPVAGRATYVAGPADAAGDPARLVTFCGPARLTALPEGGFALDDVFGQAVRRVSPDGLVRAVLPPGGLPYGCPADDGRSATETVADLTALPDSTLIVLMRSRPPAGQQPVARLVAVAPDGTADTIAQGAGIPSRDASEVTATGDGSLLMTHQRVIRWVPGTARAMTVLSGRDEQPDAFDDDGVRSRSYVRGNFNAAVQAPDGGIVATGTFNSGPGRILYIAPARPARLAVALAPHEGRVMRRAYAARYWLARRAHVRLEILDSRSRVLAQMAAWGQAGLNRLTVRGRFPIATLTARLSARGVDRQRAADDTELFFGARMTTGYVRRFLVPETVDEGGGGLNDDPDLKKVRVEACQAFGAKRADCRYSWGTRRGSQCQIASAQVTEIGTLKTRTYNCPNGPVGFPRAPDADWTEGVPGSSYVPF